MIALDTNVLLRLLVNDHPAQAKKAANVIHNKTVYLSKTVILETVWVLDSLYSYKRNQIIHALNILLQLENLIFEDEEQIVQSVEWFAKGCDFADSLHLSSSIIAKQFITFDKKLEKKANKINGRKPEIINPDTNKV